MAPVQSLPPITNLSSSTLSFLNHNFNDEQDLTHAKNSLVSDLENQCFDLDQRLIDLSKRLESSISSHASHSDRVGSLFGDIHSQLTDLDSSTSDGAEGKEFGNAEQGLGKELPALAKEVARVEAVRTYAGEHNLVGCDSMNSIVKHEQIKTALKLGILVGDIEDAVSSVMNRKVKRPSTHISDDGSMLAIKSFKQTESILASITKTRPEWKQIVSAVDHRVDKALSILRPREIADHRALLASLGWPPPLSAMNTLTSDTRKSHEEPNPLLTMQGDLKHHYCENFLALCSLQELQRQRKSRQLEGYHQDIAQHQSLWAIEELVNPISIATQNHFSKWIDKPEFIFALVHKVTRDYVDSMDELLQPLVDRAMLTGYSCREEWISGMVTSLSTYLAKKIFPVYLSQLDEESLEGVQSRVRISWLNLVDLMIDFDRKVQSLVEQSGIDLSLQEEGNLRRLSSLSVFCDRPDWLDIWAEIELTDTLDKLKPDMENERNWMAKSQGELLSDFEDYRSPLITGTFVRRLSLVIDRCRSLPSVSLRATFARLACASLIQKFSDSLLRRCQEADGLTGLTDEGALVKAVHSINSARYLESVLKDWCMDLFFLEMGADSRSDDSFNGEYGNGIFDEEIVKLETFRKEWTKRIADAVLRGFDSSCRDHMRNRKQWQEKSEEGGTVSKSFVGALDHLQGKVSVLEGNLNSIDFIFVWRSLAAEVDTRLFNNILMSGVKFSDGGVERLHGDLNVLYGVFRAWCLRPDVFFPKASEGLKVLKAGERNVWDSFSDGEQWLKEHGISRLSVHEAEKIMRSRVFAS